MNRSKAVLGAVLTALTIGLAATAPAQGANLATMTTFSPSYPTIVDNCSMDFARTPWTGGSGTWTSNFSSFSAVAGFCPGGNPTSVNIDVTRHDLSGGVGEYEAEGTLTVTVAFIVCTYAFDFESFWVDQAGGHNDFHVPLIDLTYVSGGFICPTSGISMKGWMVADA